MTTMQTIIRTGMGAIALAWLAGCASPEAGGPVVLPPDGKPAPPVKRVVTRISPDLTLLNLRNQELTTLPVGVTGLPQLGELYLDGNPRIVLGDDFTHLRTLKRLSLEACGLQRVPGVVFQVGSLEILNLQDNLLTELPADLGKLSALRVLELNRNQLGALPEAIGSLSALQLLGLDNNMIQELPASIGGLKALRTLSLAANQIAQLPDAFCALAALEGLDLRNNRLTKLPDDFGRLTALKVLTVTGNHLPRAEIQRVRHALPHLMVVE